MLIPLLEHKSSTQENLIAQQDSAVPLKPGPWGNLEALPVYIEPPDEYLSTSAAEAADSRWLFNGVSTQQLLALFQSADLTAAQRQELSDTSKWEIAPNGIYVSPSKELVEALSPQARKQIYWPMMMYPGNTFIEQTTFFPAASYSDYFANSGLSDETIALIKKLSFSYGRLYFFCDLKLVLSTLPTAAEKTRLMKTLLKKSTLLVRLHITPDSDIHDLERYWVKAGWGLDVRPMLESLSKLPQGARIDLVELLPPLPSANIYTYTFPSLKPVDQHRDCGWTALNFFRDTPDDRFTDPATVINTLRTDYYPVESDPRFGDVIALTKPNGEPIHFAVYIADDIVYTKNSANFREPYILMRYPEMVDRFTWEVPEGQSLKVQVFRNKYY